MSNNSEVKCLSCKEFFNVNDAVYTSIVLKFRGQQFDK